MASLKTYLTQLSSNYYISHGSYERNQIISSISTIKSRVKTHFGNDVNDIQIFGSWDRDTTLPRKYDGHSDIDFMIIFNHQTLQKTPETYRNWVKSFAELKYPLSTIQKDFPTVRLDMTHITFDLIPTKIEAGIFNSYYYIPDSGNNWMSTDPYSFNNELKTANTNNNFIIKPIMRLMKAWNAKAGYPFNSFDLEKKILANTIFWYKDIETGFYAAADCLSTWSGTTTQNTKVTSLQANLKNVKYHLDQGNVINAKLWLHKVLP